MVATESRSLLDSSVRTVITALVQMSVQIFHQGGRADQTVHLPWEPDPTMRLSLYFATVGDGELLILDPYLMRHTVCTEYAPQLYSELRQLLGGEDYQMSTGYQPALIIARKNILSADQRDIVVHTASALIALLAHVPLGTTRQTLEFTQHLPEGSRLITLVFHQQDNALMLEAQAEVRGVSCDKTSQRLRVELARLLLPGTYNGNGEELADGIILREA